jgi:hypothetical protein
MAIKYITAKLRHDKFSHLMGQIEATAGIKARSANTLVGGCVFFVHAMITHKMKNGKTPFECFLKEVGKGKHEAALMFMNTYYEYVNSKGMPDFSRMHRKGMNNHNGK